MISRERIYRIPEKLQIESLETILLPVKLIIVSIIHIILISYFKFF